MAWCWFVGSFLVVVSNVVSWVAQKNESAGLIVSLCSLCSVRTTACALPLCEDLCSESAHHVGDTGVYFVDCAAVGLDGRSTLRDKCTRLTNAEARDIHYTNCASCKKIRLREPCAKLRIHLARAAVEEKGKFEINILRKK